MFRSKFSFLLALICVSLITLPTFAAQTNNIKLINDETALTSIIPPKTGDLCVLDETQYQVEVTSDRFLATGIFVRSKQQVALYIRHGEKVKVEDGKIIADSVSMPPIGVIDAFLGFGQYAAGTYYLAVGNCSDIEANYSIYFRTIGDALSIPVVTECRLQQDASGVVFLKVLGLNFTGDAFVILNHNTAAKKVRAKRPDPANIARFIKLTARGNICRNLPGIIPVANSIEPVSTPFFCG